MPDHGKKKKSFLSKFSSKKHPTLLIYKTDLFAIRKRQIHLSYILSQKALFASISQFMTMQSFVLSDTLLPKNKTFRFFRHQKKYVERAVTQFNMCHL